VASLAGNKSVLICQNLLTLTMDCHGGGSPFINCRDNTVSDNELVGFWFGKHTSGPQSMRTGFGGTELDKVKQLKCVTQGNTFL